MVHLPGKFYTSFEGSILTLNDGTVRVIYMQDAQDTSEFERMTLSLKIQGYERIDLVRFGGYLIGHIINRELVVG